MSTMPSFDTGVAAMMAHSTAMGAISQNIANLRTPGYKRADTTFATMLSGIDVAPYKPGGVMAQTRKLVDVEGTIEASDRPLDLALTGKGMFVYSSTPTGDGEIYYSRRASLFPGKVDPEAPVASYLTAFEDLHLMAWRIDASGRILGTGLSDMVGIPASLNDPFPGQATTTAQLSAILPASGSASVSTDIHYFDSAGARQELRLTWTNVGINTWALQAFDAGGGALGGVETMTFDGEGVLSSAATVSAGGLFTLDVSTVTQRGTDFYRGLYTQDGVARGDFNDYQVDDRGVVSARFTSGVVTPLYRLPIALFANSNGLTEMPGDLWVEGDTSGEASFVAAGEVASVMSGARELSNVDLADAFTQLIVTQRAYSSAAQLIRTADEMTQTVRDLR